jgi:cytochrome b561
LPAGKFNAGQKVFFWCLVFSGLGQLLTGLIMYLAHGLSGTWSQIVYTVHDTLGVLLILLVLGHVYLAVIINPGPCGPFSEAGPRVRPKSALAVPNLLRRLTWRHREDFANF